MASIFDSLPRFGAVSVPRAGTNAPAKRPTVADAEVALTELQKSFAARREKEHARFTDAVDSEYWVCVCFKSRAQKDEFLARTGLDALGDKYLDGAAVAAKLGAHLETADPRIRNVRSTKRLDALVKK